MAGRHLIVDFVDVATPDWVPRRRATARNRRPWNAKARPLRSVVGTCRPATCFVSWAPATYLVVVRVVVVWCVVARAGAVTPTRGLERVNLKVFSQRHGSVWKIVGWLYRRETGCLVGVG